MHILQSISSNARLKIHKPIIKPKFYPLPFEKYIVMQGWAKFQSRQYDYFNEVVQFLQPALNREGIKIVQIGAKDDRRINGINLDLCGQISFRQSAYIIQNSLLTISVDSLTGHLASCFDTPSVVLFSNMFSNQSRPFFHSPKKLACIQADLRGCKPSYSAQEENKVINRIKPEQIVQSALELLNLSQEINVESLYFGERYIIPLIELYPDHIVPNEFEPQQNIHIRYDLVEQPTPQTENLIYHQISQRKCSVLTDKKLNLNILRQQPLRNNINQIIYLIRKENHSLAFAKELAESGIPYVLISYENDDFINEIKLSYSDYGIILRQKYQSLQDLKIDITDNTYFQTNKIFLAQGKIFNTYAHRLLNIQFSSERSLKITKELTDLPEFSQEMEWYYVYNKICEQKD